MERIPDIGSIDTQKTGESPRIAQTLQETNRQAMADILDRASSASKTPLSDISLEGRDFPRGHTSVDTPKEETEDDSYIPVPKNLETWRSHPLVARFMTKVSYEVLEKTVFTLIGSIVTIGGTGVVTGIAGWKGMLDILVSKPAVWTMEVSLVLGFLILGCMEYLYSLKVGKHAKINLKEKTNTIEYHIERNLKDLQLSDKDMAVLRGTPALPQRIAEKKNELKDDIVKSVGELIDELYASGKVQDFNKIVLDSYLLVNDDTFRALKKALEEHISPGNIIDMEKRPLVGFKQFALKAQDIKMRMIRKNASRDTLYKKAVAPILCSDHILCTAVSCIVAYAYGAIPYIGRAKKDFRFTRGVTLRLPPDKSDI